MERRLNFVAHVIWIKSHMTAEQWRLTSYTEEQWRGNVEADKLATLGVHGHADTVGSLQRCRKQGRLVARIQRYLVERALVMAEEPWHEKEGYEPNMQDMRRDIHPRRAADLRGSGRDVQGSYAPRKGPRRKN